MRTIWFLLFFFLTETSFSQTTDSLARAKITEALVNKMLRQSLLDEVVEKGGRIVMHEVQRGETWESIADLYDMTEYEILCMNPWFDVCSTGLILDIPVLLSEEKLTERLIVSKNTHYARADELYASGKYSAAIKAYTALINSSQSTLLAYYKRGCAYFKQDKYKKAMNDFGHVLRHDGGNIYTNAEENYNKALKQVQKQREARARAWGNILQAGLQAANAYLSAQQQSNMYRQSGGGMYGNVGVGSYAGLDPGSEAYMQRVQANFDNIMNNNMMQLQQYTNNVYQSVPLVMEQAVQQQNQMAQQCHDLWVRNTLGREPTTEEDQQWWTSYYASMSQAWQDVNSSVSSTTNNGRTNIGSDVVQKVKDYNAERYGDKQCNMCRGQKLCQTCNGTRYYFYGGKRLECPNCYLENGRRTGLCRTCFGTGTVYGVK